MLRIKPHLPLVWRTPTSCQLGSIAPVVILTVVSPSHERLLTALFDGLSRVTYDALARQRGLSREDADAFLAALEPALDSTLEPALASCAVTIAGNGPGRGEIRHVLPNVHDDTDVPAGTGIPAQATLAVIVESYLVSGEMAGRWLRRDIPHLLVTFDEEGATVGPLVVPGRIPCAHCLDLHQRDADASWVAIASQLVHRPHPPSTAMLRGAVATEVSRMLLDREQPLRCATRTRIRASDLGVSQSVSEFHPDCQCRSLQENVIALASRRESRSPRPTTATVDSQRA